MKTRIKTLRLKNFMTFDDTEIAFGEKINLIAGPNGSGKSSVVSGLCLALNGTPRSLGKHCKISQFVKQNTRRADLTVRLSTDPALLLAAGDQILSLGLIKPGQKKLVFSMQRTLWNDSYFTRAQLAERNEWIVNGKLATGPQVRRLLELLHIDVDNLCQFLAQDRVAELARLNGAQLLREMEKTVSSSFSFRQDTGPEETSLHALHSNLVDAQQKMALVERQVRDRETDIRANLYSLQTLRQDYENEKTARELRRNTRRLRGVAAELEIDYCQTRLRLFDTEEKDYRKEVKKKREDVKRLEEKKAQYDECFKETAARCSKKEDNTHERDVEKLQYLGQRVDSSAKDFAEVEKTVERIGREIGTQRLKVDALEQNRDSMEEELRVFSQSYKESGLYSKSKFPFCLSKDVSPVIKEFLTTVENSLGEYSFRKVMEETVKLIEKESGKITSEIAQRQIEVSDKYENEINNLQTATDKINNEKNRVTNETKTKRDKGLFSRDFAQKPFRLIERLKGEHNLTGIVVGPIIREIVPKDDTVALMLENTLPHAIKFAFVCSNIADTKLIDQAARRENIRISIITQEQTKDNSSDGRDVEASNQSMGYLKQHGVVDWLVNCFESNSIIKECLKDHCSVHKIAVCYSEPTPVQLKMILKENNSAGQRLRTNSLLTPSKNYRVTISKYPPFVASSVISPLGKRTVFILHDTLESRRKAEIVVGNLTKRITQNNTKCTVLKEGKLKMEKEIENLKGKNKKIDEWISQGERESKVMKKIDLDYGLLKTQITTEGHILQDIVKTLNDTDDKISDAGTDWFSKLEIYSCQNGLAFSSNKIKNLFAISIKETLDTGYDVTRSKLFNAQQDLEMYQKGHGSDPAKKKILKLKIEEKKKIIAKLEAVIWKDNEKTNFAESYFQLVEPSRQLSTGTGARVVFNPAATDVHVEELLAEQIMEDAPLVANVIPFAEYLKEKPPLLKMKALDRMKNEILVNEKRLEFITVDHEKAEDFRRKNKEQKKLEKIAEREKDEFGNYKKETELKRNQYETVLDNTLTKVDKSFSSLLFRITDGKGQGSVKIQKNDDFNNWALELWVKFSEKETLKILKHSTQSGGEKSLTTTLFLLALQDFSFSPFRVVDEANQGMDEVNERKLYRVLEQNACPVQEQPVKRKRAKKEFPIQYFIATPKLLEGLDYSNMRVHIMYNGPFLETSSLSIGPKTTKSQKERKTSTPIPKQKEMRAEKDTTKKDPTTSETIGQEESIIVLDDNNEPSDEVIIID